MTDKEKAKAYDNLCSKITQDHIAGLKWIERTGIVTQPVPHHVYCKELRKILENELRKSI